MEFGTDVRLRPLEAHDGEALAAAFARNRAHLAPWDPERDESFFSEREQRRLIVALLADRDAGRSDPFVLIRADDDAIVGRVNLSNIVRGAFHSADLGYWIDSALAGHGLMTRAVAAVVEHAASALELHRLQASTLLHNAASQRVLAANGFERIGMAPAYLRIAGEWQDHYLFQRILTRDGLVRPAAV
ncbi:GNAT family N-acetyltransferase [Microbacterium sp. KHB019]|uniref:GNAT family N-acetyltransferase n=1 Tax=unclassified Microbacterium TaxID=2609290 RepID=UPI0030795754